MFSISRSNIIGNGKGFNITYGNWIPSFKGLQILKKDHLKPGISMVNDLLSKENQCWKEEVINNNFISIEREAILQIPITNMEEDDSLCWMGTKDGDYTVSPAITGSMNGKKISMKDPLLKRT